MSKKADKSENEDKKGKKGKGGADASAGPSVAAHPRASRQVRQAKGWGGLAGFAIAAYLSHKAGVPTVDLGLRAIIAGLVGYMLAWACAVTIWRHLVLAELRALADHEPAHNPDLIPARAQPGAHPAPAAEASAAPSAAPAAS
jgi:uncharacterized oligopeptide transporter (OPT) family protein